MTPPNKEKKQEELNQEETNEISEELQPSSAKPLEKEPFNPHSEDDWSDDYRAYREGHYDKYGRYS